MQQLGVRFVESVNSLTPQPGPAQATINLSQILGALRRQKWVLILSVLMWVGLSVFYVLTTPKSYVAGTRVILDANLQRSAEQFGGLERMTNSEAMMESARLIILSDAIALSVVETLRLDTNASFLNPPGSGTAAIIGKVIGLIRMPLGLLRDLVQGDAPPDAAPPDTALPTETPAVAPPSPEQMAAEFRFRVARSLQSRLGVERIGRSTAMSIYFVSHDPVLAAAVVNAYAEAYVADVLNANFEATARTTDWLQERLGYLETSAREAAEAAERYRVENGLFSSRGSLISETSVVALNENLLNAIAELAQRQAVVESYRAVVARGVDDLKNGSSLGLSDEGDPAFVTSQQNLSDFVARLRQVRESFGSDHEQAVATSRQVDLMAERLFSEIERRLAAAEGALLTSESQVDALRSSLMSAVDENSADAAGQIELRALEQQAEAFSALYQTMLARYQEADQQKSFPVSNIRILSRADVPAGASGPSASRALLAALILGLMTGLTVAAIREWRERYVRTGDDVSGVINANFLGYLPIQHKARGAAGARVGMTPPALAAPPMTAGPMSLMPRIARPPELFVLSQMRSVYAETLRSIRLFSEISAPGMAHRVIAVASVRPGEGKSTLSLNLAALIRASGASVLLIDTDIRNPGLSRTLRLSAGEGLIGVMLGKASLAAATREIGDTGVHILPCIVPIGLPLPIELLLSSAMKDVIAEARSRYDYVIIDTAPLGPVVDARALLPQVHQVVLVGEWGKTKKGLLRKVLQNDPVLAEKLLGVVLSKVDMEKLPRYLNDTNVESYYGQYGDYLRSLGN